MRRSDGRCERVDPGVLDELQRHLDRMYVARLVGAHVVLDPLTLSISPSTSAPYSRASTSAVWRVFSSMSRWEPSNRTEFQPVFRQVVAHSRSGQ